MRAARGGPVVSLMGETSLTAEFSAACERGGHSTELVSVHSRGAARATMPGFRGTMRVVPRPSAGAALAIELSNLALDDKRKNLALLDRTLRPETLLLSSSVTVTVAEQSTWISHPERLVGIGAFPTFLGGALIEFALSEFTNATSRLAAEAFARSLGKEATFVADSVGMVLPRVVCCLANEAHFALMEGVAGREEIDLAMTLGTHYPAGPIAWAERIGFKQVCAVMVALQQFFGDDRYRPAPALRRAADLERAGAQDHGIIRTAEVVRKTRRR